MANNKDTKRGKPSNRDRGRDAKQGDKSGTSTLDNVRLITGFAFIIAAAFLASSIIAYFFYWRTDISALLESNPRVEVEYSNICGPMGAVVAHALVGGGFGLFALVLPVVAAIVGWRLVRYKPLRLHRVLLVYSLILVMGSLTLGAAFGTHWDIFASGLGGEYGLALSGWLTSHIGFIGTLLVIIAGWITTGIIINRNFLQLLSNAIARGYDNLAEATRNLFAKMRRKYDEEDYDELGGITPPEPPFVDPPTEDNARPEEEVTFRVTSRDDQQNDIDADEVDENGADIQEEGSISEGGDEGETDANVNDETTEEGVVNNDTEDDDPFKVVPRNDVELDDNGPVDDEQTRQLLGIDDDAEDDKKGTEDEDATEDGLVVTVVQNKPKELDEDEIDISLYDPMRDLHNYVPPTPSLLVDHKTTAVIDEEEIFQNKERIRETLLNFHIPIISMHATVGPTVTLYEIVQEPGVKISRIQGLENDLAQNLKAASVRIIAPIPGKGTVGIEVPNQTKQTVSMRSAICSEEFQNSKAELPVVIGRTIQNENYTFDLAKMPHLLVAGATGQGKSVGLNAIITSLLYRKHPAELKFVLIDPKMVEFSLYNKLERHFLAKMESEDESIVTDPKKAVYTLNALCTEMANRLEMCKKAHAKNIVEYNDKFLKRRLNPEHGHRFMPYIVVIIDEFADLIMTAKEVEAPVMRLAQKARAIGIHLIVATQRPDVKVITGGIKANFPARIAFRVMQMTDSRTIIDQPGANQLIGRGDMLFLSGGEPTRIQCAFVDTPEVENIVEHIGAQQGYPSSYNLPDYTPEQGGGDIGVSFGSEESGAPQKFDAKFAEIAREAVTSGVISTSMIQRNFEVGFNRAGRIMMQLERAGIVGPQIGAKQREIKYYDLPSLEARLQELGIF